MDEPKLSKSCDECKLRKVRCYVPTNADSPFCNNCKKRGISCQFGPRKKRGRPSGVVASRPDGVLSLKPSAVIEPPARVLTIPTQPPSSPSPEPEPEHFLGKLFVDRLLESDLEIGQDRNGGSLLKAHDNYVGSSNIAIFSDKRILSISNRLGHDRFRSLFDRLNDSMSARAKRDIRSTNQEPISEDSSTSEASIREYIDVYFEYVHPIYPFLSKEGFEKKAFDKGCAQICEQDPAFSALYHTVLALGCQRKEKELFLPGQGKAWRIFQVALSRFTEILTSKETLVHAQAVAAMAIFGRNVSCVQIEKLLTTEAARIAQALGINRAIYEDTNTDECRRTFWVIYILEKTQCFACGRDSVLNDYNISTPIPQIPESETPSIGPDYFRVLCRFSRFVSKVQKVVFSISATLLPRTILIDTIEDFELELENWKDSIDRGHRPGHGTLLSGLLDLQSIEVKIRTSFHYYAAVIALARLKINILPSDHTAIRWDSEKKLLDACRSIIETTRLIGVESHTPISILLTVPLSAIFIIFDFVIHNPLHDDTKINLALLGVASGYFSRVEISSNDILQTSLLSELGQIARDYVRAVETSGSVEDFQLSRNSGARPALQGTSNPNAQPSSSHVATNSFQSVQDLPGNGDESLAETLHGDLSVLPFEPAFADGVDLTSFFAAEMRDFFDASAMDLFSS